MPLIRRVVFFAAMTAAVSAVFAQTSVSLEAEILNIERAALRQGVSAVERHDALVRLARLRQLSGDIEGAAINWLEAAAAVPGTVDDDALLACAYCLAAMGEWERAGTALEPLLSKSQQARFLDTSIKAIASGDVAALTALAANPEYSQMKSQIIFMLWKTSRGDEAETWRRRLVTDFPQSPEGRLAAGESSSAVTIRPSPFWFLMNRQDSISIAAVERPASTAPAPQSPAPQPSAPQTRLQTGVFSRQANAQVQMDNLKRAGFSPSLEQRDEMWAVTVPAGADANRTISELKDAGFDSFPLR
jgi:tetratricopeptide (TPR) repeat protein